MTTLTWTELTDAEQDLVWDRFAREFAFRPSVHAENWPEIRESSPSVTYAIPDDRADADLEELNQDVLQAFRACTKPEERLYALDWQHICFWLRPHDVFERSAAGREVWRIPVFPDGDYSIFLADDFRFGIFGHPWEGTWCVFGAELLAALETGPPKMFRSVLRRSGLKSI